MSVDFSKAKITNGLYLIGDRTNNFYILSKIGAIAFLFYVFWFQYVYFESSLVIYGTAMLAIGSMIADIFISHDIDSRMFPYGITVNIIMCVYSLLSGIFIAINQAQLMDSLRTYFVYSLFCLTLSYVSYREKSIDWLMKTLVAISLLCRIYTVFRGHYVLGYGHVMSSSINPNNYALFLVAGMYGAVYLCDLKIKKIIMTTAILTILLWGIIECGSRKSLLAGIILITMWIIPVIGNILRSSNRAHLLSGILLIIIIAVVIYYSVTKIYVGSESQLRMIRLGSEEEGSSALRKYFYELSFRLFMENPVFGVGYNQFQEYSLSGLFSHSLYAESIACWGVLGCLIYYSSIISAIANAWRIGFKEKSYKGKTIFAILVVELFLGTGQVLYYEIGHLVLLAAVYSWISNNDFFMSSTHTNLYENEVITIHESKYIK